MSEQDLYRAWFKRVAGFTPFPYQVRLATGDSLPDVLRAPTGSGKTAAVSLAWMWRSLVTPRLGVRSETPRRLIYCLPMRTLVEQTCAVVGGWLEAAGLSERVKLYKLMGGAIDQRWDDKPAESQVLIGTQDQLLSRALNRGYATSRYRWPVHFAWLNNDCLWVMDEVQLMGAGLATTAQLQGLRDSLGGFGPSASIWMSATMDIARLRTVDHPLPAPDVLDIDGADRSVEALQMRLNARKAVSPAEIVISGKDKVDAPLIAERVLQEHVPGSLTLVVCNRVSRALAVFRSVQKRAPDAMLVHSRFRAAERLRLNARLVSGAVTGIVIATQVVEAGLDLDAETLFTELAPWSSFVQRVGRCNRRGAHDRGRVFWVDISLDKKNSLPYDGGELEWTRAVLLELDDAGPERLKAIEAPPQNESGLVLRRRDLIELFDTSPDLAGHDVDIARFIRDTEESDVLLAWRRWSGAEPEPSYALHARELCRVSIAVAAGFLKKSKGWSWDSLDARWERVDRMRLRPGLTILLHVDEGGYSETLGFTGEPKHKPAAVSLGDEALLPERFPLETDAGDPLSTLDAYVTLTQHAEDAAGFAKELCDSLAEVGLPSGLIIRSARWHDLGKSHRYFQELLTQRAPDLQGEIWAKSNHRRPHPDHKQPGAKTLRPHFRHELASALVALELGEPFLLVYLVAAHHGKVRLSIRPRPGELAPDGGGHFALGVHEGDRLPRVELGAGVAVPESVLRLDCMELGPGSWTGQALALLSEHGPFRLAMLESCVRVADWRASRYRQGRHQEVSGD